MNIDSHLERLYASGCRNDASASDRSSMMLNITPSTGVFLDLLVSGVVPQRILELGTSNGYSTIWLARAAARVGAQVDTVDASSKKSDLAERNLAACELQDVVTLHVADCGDFLCQSDDMSYEFVFLDSDRSAYSSWLPSLIRVIRFGILVVDNATSHPNEMIEFTRQLTADHGFAVTVLPIGNGQMLVQNHV